MLTRTLACEALFWTAGGLLGESSEVVERGGLGTNGDETNGVLCTTEPGYDEEESLISSSRELSELSAIERGSIINSVNNMQNGIYSKTVFLPT